MANTAHFRFYEELNDFLPAEKCKVRFVYQFNGSPSIKDAIEAIGVPHVEVDLVIVNGRSVGFDYHLSDNDEVSVYPVFEALDISPLVRLREKPLRDPRFICDVHLGKLARLLRLAGFNTLYRNDYTDPQIVEYALPEKRCILTRDRGILKRSAVTHGYCLRSTVPQQQAREVIERFDLHAMARPFSLCIECNGPISRANKDSVLPGLPQKTSECHDEFYKCDSCGRVYWQGSHFDSLRQTVSAMLRNSQQPLCVEFPEK
jgi:uncharacterized protein with PIN domain